MKYLFLFLFIVNSSFALEVNEIEVVDIFKPKKQTPSALVPDTLSKPNDDKFYTSNDLTRYMGSFYVSIGELLYLKGRVTDAFGIPISNATIRIWHTNSAGKNQNLLRENSMYVDENFTISGTTRTDNLGYYGFKTIFPGYENPTRAPHINIIISHINFETITTEIYFNNHPMNIKDPIYLSYSEEEQSRLTARVMNVVAAKTNEGKIAIFDVIMDGVHAYKRY